MEVLLAVLVFVAVVGIAGVVRSEGHASAWSDAPRRTPDPSPRDRYAVTGMLDRAPIPSWG